MTTDGMKRRSVHRCTTDYKQNMGKLANGEGNLFSPGFKICNPARNRKKMQRCL